MDIQHNATLTPFVVCPGPNYPPGTHDQDNMRIGTGHIKLRCLTSVR